MEPAKPSLDDLRIERGNTPPPRSWTWLVLLLILLLAAGGGAWWFLQPRPLEVRTARAQETAGHGADRTVLNSSGYVTARRDATVSSKVTGKVVEVLVEEGLKVTNGQVLARLDDANIRAGLRLAEAQLAAATNALPEIRVRIIEAEQEFRRQSNLLTNRIAAEADFQRADASLKALQARLQKQLADITVSEREVASWQQQLDDTIIRAPFSGIVTSKNAQPGEMISPISAGGGFTRTGICTIVDMESLEIEIDVNESYIGRVEAGQGVEATLDAYPEWKIPSKVIAIIPTADRQKSTVKVRVGFEKLDPRILPEMGVKVAFRQAGGNGAAPPGPAIGVLIPKDAVLKQDGKDVVYIIRDGRAERRAVTIRSVEAGQALVAAGLVAGEQVAIEHPAGLGDSAAVRAVAEADKR